MQTTLLLVACLLAPFVSSDTNPPAPFSDHCIVGEQNLYPPKGKSVPWYTIDLDADPYHRWDEVATDYAAGIQNLIQQIIDLIVPIFGEAPIDWVNNNMALWDTMFPEPYQSEIKGIADVTGVPLGEIVLYNIFYEVFTVCTSIVAEDPTGRLYHARNLDFGLFLGWDRITHDWAVTEKLRPLIINLQWKKNGQILYKTVNFAGYIGVYNGVKQNAFTISANERFNIDGGFMGIIQWLNGSSDAQWMSWLVRETLENYNTYADAIQHLSNTPVMAPVYYIVGGAQSGEGTVLVRGRNDLAGSFSLNKTDPNGWYVLQTNYDYWVQPLYLDDRRTPGNQCMQKLGQNGVGFAGIFNVLSSTTNFNKLTTYTVLMQVNDFTLETYLQKCPDPCWGW